MAKIEMVFPHVLMAKATVDKIKRVAKKAKSPVFYGSDLPFQYVTGVKRKENVVIVDMDLTEDGKDLREELVKRLYEWMARRGYKQYLIASVEVKYYD